jgi:hypothetical protein
MVRISKGRINIVHRIISSIKCGSCINLADTVVVCPQQFQRSIIHVFSLEDQLACRDDQLVWRDDQMVCRKINLLAGNMMIKNKWHEILRVSNKFKIFINTYRAYSDIEHIFYCKPEADKRFLR